MRLIREVRVALALGQYLEALEFGGAVPLGMTCHIQANATDPILINSLDPLGNAQTHVECQPLLNNGMQAVFGGPLCNRVVSINWQGVDNAKRGVFRFYDEPIAPFGSVEVNRTSEVVNALATSNAAQFQATGDWFGGMEVAWSVDQAYDWHVDVDTPAFSGQLAAATGAAAGKAPSLILGALNRSGSVTIVNQGAVPATFSMYAIGRMGFSVLGFVG